MNCGSSRQSLDRAGTPGDVDMAIDPGFSNDRAIHVYPLADSISASMANNKRFFTDVASRYPLRGSIADCDRRNSATTDPVLVSGWKLPQKPSEI
jgi:hypothetical protein